MPTYKILVNDRTYNSWDIYETSDFAKIDLKINPIENKLFSNDVFFFDENNKLIILHSSIRVGTSIPGVLMIENNKTYGRHKVGTGKNSKLLYKCIPDDMRLPPFLVPYEIKNVGFSKVYKNLYVTFNYDNWDDKHPIGKLDNVIGQVDIIDNFYEYQLYCKSLNASIQKFNKDTSLAIDSRSQDALIESIKLKYPNIEDRTDKNIWNILTIDPPKSLDFDDGFSLINLDDNGNKKMLSIYIANVSIWLDVLNLWCSFSKRISTIYLPDKKRPMLPTILSDSLCSLQKNVTRIAFVMDVYIENNEIYDIKYNNCFIKVYKNYCYEETSLLNDNNYKILLENVMLLSKKFKYINNVRNSHEMVCYLMVLMNYYSAIELLKHKTGIFRSTLLKKEIIVPDDLPDDVSKFIKIWNSASGQYISGSEVDQESNNTRHELLNIDAYIHITSPIRRLVDLLNMIRLQQKLEIIKFSENVDVFYSKWIDNIDYINVTMRSIRKVQCECSLLDLCQNDKSVMEKEYSGYLFDKISRNDGLYQYIVFLPNLKLSSRITLRENYENYENKKFRLFLFNDEERFKRKIRLQIVDNYMF